MTTKGRGRPAKIAAQAEELSKALAFIDFATKDHNAGLDDLTGHVALYQQMAIASNGLVSAGYPIVEDLSLCPHLGKLRTALLKCGKSLALTVTPTGQLSVKGESGKWLVPCIGFNELPYVAADPMIAPLTEEIKTAFKVCSALATEKADRFFETSLLLEDNTCTGTNGFTALQYWHGISFPPNTVVPKTFAANVAAAPVPAIGFGITWSVERNRPSSITFWFEGGGWIKTQCYFDQYPDVTDILNKEVRPIPAPPKLFEGIDAVLPFNDRGRVTFAKGSIRSHPTGDAPATWDVPELDCSKTFNGKVLKMIKPYFDKIDLQSYHDRCFFFDEGGKVRGAIMCITVEIEQTEDDDGLNTEVPF